ncbi:unnamed protein product [Urochloa decumbens]|uniref:DUF295 domain-containing protein n=1 Tax=Urochloa decumbens TaxID=240449 RepID=A0ABC8XMR9_9POAL
MGAGAFGWKRRGEWALPFTGHAHFDGDLGGFVGLCKDPDAVGHLCSCVLRRGRLRRRRRAAPAWKLGKENLFSEDPGERHVGATLVYMGCKSKFCLVECVVVGVGDDNAGQCYMYRLTTFSLSYDENGDLTTGKSRRVRYYKVPSKASTEFLLESPVAFWL